MNFLQQLLSSPSSLIRLVIGLCYMALGAVFIVYRLQITLIDPSYNPILGALCISYGVFRLYRAVNDMRNA